ncbi:MAG: hypothetical protein EMLJLAPB_00361 [Candidatus Argoarchaeum ethanivorans]|uniref:DUF2551 domain-containing protein n=1 Tax=Candidatus Argoarchaeum ethanivorans TaxID=2608793 RepID=A0A811TFU6_9EURY|nr:MAG: hypothetical protein EMLJLAPB_00361 [Candidatus Argoarchaeum ethanivorans]CAD6494339.1 MAG: hypothetical protein LAKADJCE_00704 [Candidatus Argoarchaeum ethanivorans]
MLSKTDERIRERTKRYLIHDDTNVRKAVLKLFLEDNTFTTEAIYKYLTSKDFDMNYRGVSAMVGLMNTRLGVLRIDVTGNHNIYSLKKEYKETVKTILDNY